MSITNNIILKREKNCKLFYAFYYVSIPCFLLNEANVHVCMCACVRRERELYLSNIYMHMCTLFDTLQKTSVLLKVFLCIIFLPYLVLFYVFLFTVLSHSVHTLGKGFTFLSLSSTVLQFYRDTQTMQKAMHSSSRRKRYILFS